MHYSRHVCIMLIYVKNHAGREIAVVDYVKFFDMR